MAASNHITKSGQEPNLISLAVSVGSRPFIFAAVVGSKLPLSASPSLTVCRTLQLRGVDHLIKLRQDFFGAQSRSVLRRDKLLLLLGILVFWTGFFAGAGRPGRRPMWEMCCRR